METPANVLTRFAPVTSQGYMIGADLRACAEAVVAEYKRRYIEFENVWQLPIPRLRLEPGVSELERGLQSLYPLSNPPTRYLVLPTTAAGWTAVLTNNSAFENQDFMAGLNRITGGRVVYHFSRDHTLKKVRGNLYVGHAGGHALYVYDSGKPFEPDRALSCVKENGGWKFDQYGEPFPFEDVSRYQLLTKRDRFDGQLLREYLKAMGLFPFDPSFFPVSDSDPGILVERTDSGTPKDPISYLPESRIERDWYAELGIPLKSFKAGP
jgi:hypothetical protein